MLSAGLKPLAPMKPIVDSTLGSARTISSTARSVAAMDSKETS